MITPPAVIGALTQMPGWERRGRASVFGVLRLSSSTASLSLARSPRQVTPQRAASQWSEESWQIQHLLWGFEGDGAARKRYVETGVVAAVSFSWCRVAQRAQGSKRNGQRACAGGAEPVCSRLRRRRANDSEQGRWRRWAMRCDAFRLLVTRRDCEERCWSREARQASVRRTVLVDSDGFSAQTSGPKACMRWRSSCGGEGDSLRTILKAPTTVRLLLQEARG